MQAIKQSVTDKKQQRRLLQSRRDQEQPRQFLRDTEAAELTGIAVSTYRYWRLVGGGPPFCRLGRSIRYEIDDLRAWTRARMGGGEPAEATR